jgi:hypothetical protein
MSDHKYRSKNETNTNKLYTAIRSYGGFSNWTFEIIESCTCETVLEARKRERSFCEELRADLNSIRPQASKEERREYDRKCYKNNLEKIKQTQSQYFSQKIHCDACNCECIKGNISKHIKTKKHLKNLELENNESKNESLN